MVSMPFVWALKCGELYCIHTHQSHPRMGLRMHREGERVGSGEREFVLPFFCFLTTVFSWVTISYITGLRVLIVLVEVLCVEKCEPGTHAHCSRMRRRRQSHTGGLLLSSLY